MPKASVAEQLTSVLPAGNSEPEACEQVTATSPQLSVAETEKLAVEPPSPHALTTTGAAGQLSTGAVVSPVTVTLKPQEAVLPEPSVAEQETAVSPTGKVEPEAYEQLTGAGPQLSVAEAAKVAGAPAGEHVSITCEAGQLTAGFELSTTVTRPTHWSLASPSEAVSLTGCVPRGKEV